MGQKVQFPIDQLDQFTGFPCVVQSDHAYIHQGKAFTLSGKSGSVAAGATFIISFQTPSNKYAHLRPSIISSTANLGELRIAEGSTFSSGSAATAYNRNYNSSKTSGITIKTGVTMTVEGTIKHYFCIGTGGNPSQNSGGGSGEANERVLKPSTDYTFRFENIGSSTATVFYYDIFWYEEESGV